MKYTLTLCPEDKVLNIKCRTKEEAKSIAREYYPAACFMDIADNCCAVYERRDMEGLYHVGNIWREA